MKNLILIIFILSTVGITSQKQKKISPFEQLNKKVVKQSKKYKEEGYGRFFSKLTEGMPTMIEGISLSHNKLYASHSSLPIGSIAKITNLENGLFIYVKIVDEIFEKSNYIIELTKKAAYNLRCDFTSFVKIRVEAAENDKYIKIN